MKQSIEWISVDVRLPKFEEKVLVCEAGKEDSIKIAMLESCTKSKDSTSLNWNETKFDTYYGTVTHWAELPKTEKK